MNFSKTNSTWQTGFQCGFGALMLFVLSSAFQTSTAMAECGGYVIIRGESRLMHSMKSMAHKLESDSFNGQMSHSLDTNSVNEIIAETDHSLSVFEVLFGNQSNSPCSKGNCKSAPKRFQSPLAPHQFEIDLTPIDVAGTIQRSDIPADEFPVCQSDLTYKSLHSFRLDRPPQS